MSIYVEFGTAGGGAFDGMHLPIEQGAGLVWSEAPAAGTATQAASGPGVFTITAAADVYISIGTVPTPADTAKRRRLLSGGVRSFSVPAGAKVAWSAT